MFWSFIIVYVVLLTILNTRVILRLNLNRMCLFKEIINYIIDVIWQKRDSKFKLFSKIIHLCLIRYDHKEEVLVKYNTWHKVFGNRLQNCNEIACIKVVNTCDVSNMILSIEIIVTERTYFSRHGNQRRKLNFFNYFILI